MPKKTPKSKSRQLLAPAQFIERKIYILRDQKVMLSGDIAELYKVEARVLIQAVKRNLDRFPEDFMYQLTPSEAISLRSQFVILNARGRHTKYAPYAFTEQGVAMLSAVLNSKRAIQMSIAIVRVFVKLRELTASHSELARRVQDLDRTQIDHGFKIDSIIDAIQEMKEPPPEPAHRRIGFTSGQQVVITQKLIGRERAIVYNS